MSQIHTLTMPKWGLSMEQGTVNAWTKQVGDAIRPGDELLDVETDKISSGVEAPFSGILRRQVAQEGEVLPVGALLGIVAEGDVSEAEIDAVITDFLANFTPASAGEEDSGPKPEKIQIGDWSIRYLKRGEGGEPLLLIHGLGGDLNNWLFNHEALAEKRSVYALDLPGHGESSKALKHGSLDELADAVLGLMDGLKLDAVHLVGHSMGGAVAMTVAARSPARVKSLTLVCSAGLGPEINADYIRGFVAGNSRNTLKPPLQKLFSNAELVTRQLIDDMLKYKRLEGVDAALSKIEAAQFADGKQAKVLRDKLPGLAPRIQVIWGEKDQVIPASHADGLPKAVRACVIPGQGHMVQLEAAQEVNRLIGEFLEA